MMALFKAATAAALSVLSVVVTVVPGPLIKTSQIASAMVLVSMVTAPFPSLSASASSRPFTDAPLFAVMDVKAKMVPLKIEPVPSVAELPTCQKTRQASAPLIRTTELADAVVSVDPAWKIQTEFGLPWPLSLRVPVSPNEDGLLYTPATRVKPPRSEAGPKVIVGVRPAASLYAVTRSILASCVTAFPP